MGSICQQTPKAVSRELYASFFVVVWCCVWPTLVSRKKTEHNGTIPTPTLFLFFPTSVSAEGRGRPAAASYMPPLWLKTTEHTLILPRPFSAGSRGTYSDPGSVTEGNQTAGQKLCQLRPRRTVGEAFFPLNLAVLIYFRVNSDFTKKSLNAMQAVPRLACRTEAGRSIISPEHPERHAWDSTKGHSLGLEIAVQ